MDTGRPKLTRKEAIVVLGDYPDADLRGFDIEGAPDVDALAAEAVAERMEAILRRWPTPDTSAPAPAVPGAPGAAE